MAKSEHARPYVRNGTFVAYITWMTEIPRGTDAKVPFSYIEIIHYDKGNKIVDVSRTSMVKAADDQYSFVWRIPPDADLTKYYVTYDARVNGNDIRYTEIFEVIEPSGDYSTYEDSIVRIVSKDWTRDRNKYYSEWTVVAPHPGCYNVRFYLPERMRWSGADLDFFNFVNLTTAANNYFPISIPNFPSRMFENFDLQGSWNPAQNITHGEVFEEDTDFKEGTGCLKVKLTQTNDVWYSISKEVSPDEDWTPFESFDLWAKCPDINEASNGSRVQVVLTDVYGNKSYTEEKVFTNDWSLLNFDLTQINPLLLNIAQVEIVMKTGLATDGWVYLDGMYLRNDNPPEPLGCTPEQFEEGLCGGKHYHYDAEFVVQENENLYIEVKNVMLMPSPQQFSLSVVEHTYNRGISGII